MFEHVLSRASVGAMENKVIKVLVTSKLYWNSVEVEGREVVELYFKSYYLGASTLQIISFIGFRILLSRAMLTQYLRERSKVNIIKIFLRKFHLFDELRQYAIYSKAYRYK